MKPSTTAKLAIAAVLLLLFGGFALRAAMRLVSTATHSLFFESEVSYAAGCANPVITYDPLFTSFLILMMSFFCASSSRSLNVL